MRAHVIFGENTIEYIEEHKNKLSDHYIVGGKHDYWSLYELFKTNGEANRSFWVGQSLFNQYIDNNISLAELCALLQIFNARVSIRWDQHVNSIKLLDFALFWADLGLEINEIEDMEK